VQYNYKIFGKLESQIIDLYYILQLLLQLFYI